MDHNEWLKSQKELCCYESLPIQDATSPYDFWGGIWALGVNKWQELSLVKWSENQFTVYQETRRLMGLEVHQEGVKRPTP